MQVEPSKDKDLSFARLSDLNFHVAVKMWVANNVISLNSLTLVCRSKDASLGLHTVTFWTKRTSGTLESSKSELMGHGGANKQRLS